MIEWLSYFDASQWSEIAVLIALALAGALLKRKWNIEDEERLNGCEKEKEKEDT